MSDTLPGYWPEGGQAAAHLARVQKMLDARGLTGTESRLKLPMRKATAAFQARDLASVVTACAALVDAIEEPAGDHHAGPL